MNYSLHFNQKFPPETEAIARLVRLASLDLGFLSKEEISEQTTISTGKNSGKVEPHILYASAMKLITFEKDKGKYKCGLTELGKVLLLEDPYIVENISKLLMQYFLADKHSPAQFWSFAFNEFIPKMQETFSKDLLKNAAKREFDVSEVTLTPFNTCYNDKRCLESVHLFTIDTDSYTVNPHKLSKENRFLYAYLLLYKWEQLLPERSEITFDEIMDDLCFGRPFVWNEQQVRDALDLMQEDGILNINAQLSPITVIKKQHASSCLSRIYSLLI
ncbi:DUF4007 family protein [Ureibacillus sp. NPDC094379]